MRTIDISGPDGNAYFLLSTAKNLSKQLGMDGDAILDDMRSGDYENLLDVFEENFGTYVILENR